MMHLDSPRNVGGRQSSSIGISRSSPELTEDQIERGREWLRRLHQSPLDTLPARAEVARIQTMMMQPVEPVWCLARIAALLSPYYEKDTPQGIRQMEAEDWLAALADYPRWAIERSARWWKSADNPDRRKRPIEGDIVARCKVELDGVRSAIRIHDIKSGGREIEPSEAEARVSSERAAEILAEAGFQPKKF